MRNLLLIIVLFSILFGIGCFAIAQKNQSNPSYQNQLGNPQSQSTNISTMTMPDKILNIPSNGNINIVIPHLTITNTNGLNTDATDINFTSIYDIKSKLENHRHMELTIKNIQVTNIPIPISINGSLHFSFNLDNVNIEALRKLMLLSQALKSKDSTPERNQQIVNQMTQIVPQVVTNTSKLTVDEAYNTAQGAIINNYQVTYPPNLPLPKDSTELMHNLRGTVFIKVAISLLDSYLAALNVPPSTQPSSNQKQQADGSLFIQQMISAMIKQNLDAWIKQGYIIKDKSDYIFSLTFDKGVFRVNGKVFDPSQLMQPVSAKLPPSTIKPATPGITTTP